MAKKMVLSFVGLELAATSLKESISRDTEFCGRPAPPPAGAQAVNIEEVPFAKVLDGAVTIFIISLVVLPQDKASCWHVSGMSCHGAVIDLNLQSNCNLTARTSRYKKAGCERERWRQPGGKGASQSKDQWPCMTHNTSRAELAKP